MPDKWLKFKTLFAAMLAKNGASLSPTEKEMHEILTAIKDAYNDDIDHSDASCQEKNFAKLSHESFIQGLERFYSKYRNNYIL